MTPNELRERTLQFAIAIHRLVKPLLAQPDSRHVGMQLFRAASSVACNYRAAGMGRSDREFTSKIGIVAEEADETLFWLLFLSRTRMLPAPQGPEFEQQLEEARSLVRIFVASYRTSKRRLDVARRKDKEARERRASRTPASKPD